MHGPKGVAALYVRRGVQLSPLVAGHQERGRRGGTENVAAIVGFGKACALAAPGEKDQSIRGLRDLLERRLLAEIAGAHRNGPAELRVANTLNVRFHGCDGETLLIGLDLLGICASSGAACSSGTQTPSHVLRAMGLSAAQAQGSLRFSLGSETTLGDVEQVLAALPDLVLGCRR